MNNQISKRMSFFIYLVFIPLIIINFSLTISSDAQASSACLFGWDLCSSWFNNPDCEGQVLWCTWTSSWHDPMCLWCPWVETGECDCGGGGGGEDDDVLRP